MSREISLQLGVQLHILRYHTYTKLILSSVYKFVTKKLKYLNKLLSDEIMPQQYNICDLICKFVGEKKPEKKRKKKKQSKNMKYMFLGKIIFILCQNNTCDLMGHVSKHVSKVKQCFKPYFEYFLKRSKQILFERKNPQIHIRLSSFSFFFFLILFYFEMHILNDPYELFCQSSNIRIPPLFHLHGGGPSVLPPPHNSFNHFIFIFITIFESLIS